MKVSVLTPTYNDSVSIEETLKSLVDQTHTNWEWIVINDGSTDDTEEHIQKMIKKYDIENKVKYVYQENADQLNALIHGTKYLDGEFVFVLHSDDLLPSETFFEDCVSILNQDTSIAGVFGNLQLINERSEIIGTQFLQEYQNDKSKLPRMLLWLGRNLYSDVAFHRAEIYKTVVLENYLTWNMPLWMDVRKEICSLPYKKVSFPVLKYRIHEGNYINNELGRMNVINGELRTAIQLMKYYTIPAYRIQYLLFRIMNKVLKRTVYPIKYENRETKDKYSVVRFIVEKRYPEGVHDNPFLESVLSFYEKASDRILEIPKLPEGLKIYYGKDVRCFNKKMMNQELEEFYVEFMREMKLGFGGVLVHDDEDLKVMRDILKFMCIDCIKVEKHR